VREETGERLESGRVEQAISRVELLRCSPAEKLKILLQKAHTKLARHHRNSKHILKSRSWWVGL